MKSEVIEAEVVYGGHEETASIGTRTEKSDSDIHYTGNESISHHSSNGVPDHSAVYDSDEKSQEQNDGSRESTTIEMAASSKHSDVEQESTVEADESNRGVSSHSNLIDSDEISHGRSAKSSSETTVKTCLLYTSPSPRDQRGSRMPSSA